MQFYGLIFSSMYTIQKGVQIFSLLIHLNLPLLLLLRLCLSRLLGFAFSFTLQLVGTANSDVLRAEVAEQVLQDVLNQPAAAVVKDHQHGECDLEFGGERNQAQLLVDLRHELSGAGECNSGCTDQTPVHRPVLANRLAEGTALVVDGEGRDLLDQLEQVDGAVQKGWLELALEINVVLSPVRLVSKQVIQILFKGCRHTVQSCRRIGSSKSR